MQLFIMRHTGPGNGLLEEEEARHCVRVMRLKAGARIHCIDGNGNKYTCTITSLKKTRVTLSVEERIPEWGEKDTFVSLVVCPLRIRDRFEFLIEKAVELGVNEVIPLVTDRTVKPTVKASRLNSIMLSALKQSKRSRKPRLGEVISLKEFLEEPANGSGYIGFCEVDTPLTDYAEEIRQATSLSLIIGPEGDFTHNEIQLAQSRGLKPVSFGENRLRTETAAIYGLSSFKLLNGW